RLGAGGVARAAPRDRRVRQSNRDGAHARAIAGADLHGPDADHGGNDAAPRRPCAGRSDRTGPRPAGVGDLGPGAGRDATRGLGAVRRGAETPRRRAPLAERGRQAVSPEADAVERQVAGIGGWLTPKEGRLLYDLARRCTGRGVIVEIGSWKGKSTIWLASGSRRGAGVPVYAIDPHTAESDNLATQSAVPTFAEFTHNIRQAGVADLVVALVTTSAEAARDFERPVELIFIDGAHDYASVALD